MGVVGRPRFVAKQERFWQLRSSGMLLQDIQAELGTSASSSWVWVLERGGIPPRPAPPKSGRYLSLEEREVISIRYAEGVSKAEIARELGRHPATVGREITRNGRPSRDSRRAQDYRPVLAQRRADDRARRPKPSKLCASENAELHAYTQAKLTLRWSPAQIAKRLPQDFPDRPEMRVSPETIYQALYVQSRGALRRELTACLRTGRAVRRPKKRADTRSGRIPGMINISERPAEVEDRAVPGHWEGDLIIGTGSSAIGTLVERSTRFVMLLHLPKQHRAEDVEAAMLTAIATMPAQLRRSVTWDQGREMTNHASITLASGLDIYFCDPHSPWQRGSNENTNGLLRQYFPKGTNLRLHDAAHLQFVADQLNDRPRETLGFQSPREALTRALVAATD